MVFLRRSSYKFHTVLEFTNLVINGSIKLHLHPPNGDMGAGVMRPLEDVFSTGNETVLGTIDITRGAFCAVGETTACPLVAGGPSASVPPPTSKCWGETRNVRVGGFPSAGIWVCTDRRDIDSS